MTQSVSVSLGVFAAKENVRRNIASLSAGYDASAGTVASFAKTVLPSEVWSLSVPDTVSVALVKTSSPVQADVSYASIPDRAATTARIAIAKVFLTDDKVTQFVFENTGGSEAELLIILG